MQAGCLRSQLRDACSQHKGGGQEVKYEQKIIAQDHRTHPGSVAPDEHTSIGGHDGSGPASLSPAAAARDQRAIASRVPTNSSAATDSSVPYLWSLWSFLSPILGSVRTIRSLHLLSPIDIEAWPRLESLSAVSQETQSRRVL